MIWVVGSNTLGRPFVFYFFSLPPCTFFFFANRFFRNRRRFRLAVPTQVGSPVPFRPPSLFGPRCLWLFIDFHFCPPSFLKKKCRKKRDLFWLCKFPFFQTFPGNFFLVLRRLGNFVASRVTFFSPLQCKVSRGARSPVVFLNPVFPKFRPIFFAERPVLMFIKTTFWPPVLSTESLVFLLFPPTLSLLWWVKLMCEAV